MLNQLTKKILELADVQAIQPNLDILKIISKETSQSAQLVLFDKEKSTIFVLTTNNNPQLITKLLEKISSKGFKFDFYYTDDASFQHTLNWYAQLEHKEQKTQEAKDFQENVTGKEAMEEIKKLYQEKNNYSEGDFILEVIKLSYKAGSSDLHFQPEEVGVCLRLRKDGVLKEIIVFPHKEFQKYLIKLKFMSGTKLNVDYIPQDGRFDFEVIKGGKNKKIDVRVGFMPGLRGESIVMRFLDASQSIMPFTNIGFMDESLEILSKKLTINYGMIIVTGPTGSGKSTTLYSILNYLNDPEKKIITLEDPVEYELKGIQQCQMNPSKGYTYEKGLKATLRQDPDIIMVGEIRSLDVAEIAISAALTGHLVLSTLHTNTAIEAISRLLNMGVKPFMLAPALDLVIGQRLIRKLHTCRTMRDVTLPEKVEIESAMKKIKDAKPTKKLNFTGKIAHAAGCSECSNDGYKGRMVAVETFDVNEDIKNMILQDKSTLDIYGMARQRGYLTMKDDAYIKMIQGMTSLDEIRRVL